MTLDTINGRRIIRGKILEKSWCLQNGLEDFYGHVEAQSWHELFEKKIKKVPVYPKACQEFYSNLEIRLIHGKERAFSEVAGVRISFDDEQLADILDIPYS